MHPCWQNDLTFTRCLGTQRCLLIAAHLRDTVGVADRATLLATAALALSQINRVICAVRSGSSSDAGSDSEPPKALNATLEFDVHAGTITARHWSKHPLCSC